MVSGELHRCHRCISGCRYESDRPVVLSGLESLDDSVRFLHVGSNQINHKNRVIFIIMLLEIKSTSNP